MTKTRIIFIVLLILMVSMIVFFLVSTNRDENREGSVRVEEVTVPEEKKESFQYIGVVSGVDGDTVLVTLPQTASSTEEVVVRIRITPETKVYEPLPPTEEMFREYAKELDAYSKAVLDALASTSTAEAALPKEPVPPTDRIEKAEKSRSDVQQGQTVNIRGEKESGGEHTAVYIEIIPGS